MNKLRFHFFHLMPYPYLPPTAEFPSTWATLSNENYDPRHGHQLYNEYIDQLAAAERYGYDSVIVNEHHANAYGTMPAPNLIAAMLVQRTRDIPIGIVGNAIPLHGNPLRVAEEIAMLDVISGGRIISGFVRGIGPEYFNNGVDPTASVGRFWEAHDLIIKAWTEPGPFVWQGEHYHIPNVNPWPRPLQKPHPPIWIPGHGSFETIRKVAEYRYTYLAVFAPSWFHKKSFDLLRKIANDYGYEASEDQFNACVPTYVAETDEQAHREAKAHLAWLFNTGLKIPWQIYFPAGYMSKPSFTGFMGAIMKYDLPPISELSYDQMLEDGYIIVGSPQTVIDKYAAYCEELGAGGMVLAGSPVGPMPHWMVMKNMQIFAEEVIPHFRDEEGKPDYMKRERLIGRTYAERAATVGKPAQPARSVVTGSDALIEHRQAHLPEVIDPTFGKTKAAAE